MGLGVALATPCNGYAPVYDPIEHAATYVTMSNLVILSCVSVNSPTLESCSFAKHELILTSCARGRHNMPPPPAS